MRGASSSAKRQLTFGTGVVTGSGAAAQQQQQQAVDDDQSVAVIRSLSLPGRAPDSTSRHPVMGDGEWVLRGAAEEE